MKKIQFVILAIIGWYFLLIILHYFNQRPLWNDEACVFLSIGQKTPFELFHTPLLSLQEFPRTYLYSIQQFSGHFNFHLLALRFFPFVCMFTAFLLWIRIAQAELGENIFLLTFLACWVASAPLIYYAAELKQYSMDVLAAAIFIFVLRDENKLSRWYWALPLFGLFSYPSFFFMPLAWYALLRKGSFNKLIFYTLLALMTAGIVYRFDISVNNLSIVQKEWNSHFISFDSWNSFLKSWGQSFDNLTSRWFVEHPKWIRMVARVLMPIGFMQLIFGFWKTFKQDKFTFRSVNSIAFAVWFIHLFFGVLHKYPFVVPRTSLFFAPMLLLLFVKGLSWIKERQIYVYRAVHYSFLVYLGYVSIGIARMILAGDLGAEPYIW